MSGGRQVSRVAWAAMVLLAAGALLPVGRLAWAALRAGEAGGAHGFLEGRVLGLLARSLGIAGGATVVALGGGVLLGILLARVALPGRPVVLAALAGVLCVSPYVLALGWLGGSVSSAWAGALVGRPVAVAWILGTARLPLAALLVAAGLRSASLAPEEAALLAVGPGARLAAFLVRRSGAVVAATAALVFILCLGDYSVASLLQVPTYPVEVFLEYAGRFRPGAAARACLPLVACGMVFAAGLAPLLHPLATRGEGASAARRWPLPPGARGGAMAAALALAGLALLPLPGVVAGAAEAWREVPRIAWQGREAILHSIGYALATALVAILLAWPASALLERARRLPFAVLAAIVLLPLAIPSSALGIAWAELAGGRAGDGIGSHLLPVLALAARLGGVAALLLAAARARLPRAAMEAARLHSGSLAAIEVRIVGPHLAGPALAVAGLVFALALNDVGLLVLTVPPGIEVLPLRADNLLHYGLASEASVLALATVIAAVAPAGVALLGARRLVRGTRS